MLAWFGSGLGKSHVLGFEVISPVVVCAWSRIFVCIWDCFSDLEADHLHLRDSTF